MKTYPIQLIALLSLAITLIACGPTDAERASQRINDARKQIAVGELQKAHITLDSIHILYPTEVEQRRIASALDDSINYLENKRSLAYFDSQLQTLLPQVDPLLTNFRYEKDERYEDNGRYVYKSLSTDANTARSFLQVYVLDNRETVLKSYYYGADSIRQTTLTLRSEGVEISATGDNHIFKAGWAHEILTISTEESLNLLNFVSSHLVAPIEVVQEGKNGTNHFFLTPKEKEALSETYRLGFLMKDIHQSEQQIRILQAHISHYEQNNSSH